MDQPIVTADTHSSPISALRYQQLRKRRLPRLPALLFDRKRGKNSPFAWGLPPTAEWQSTRQLLLQLLPYHRGKDAGKAMDRACTELLEEWVEPRASRNASAQHMLETVAWAAAAPRLTRVVTRPLWEELMRLLDERVTTSPPVAAMDDPWRFHVSAELGLWLACLFPDVPQWAGHFAAGREALTHGICELTDGEGLPSDRHRALLRPLLACWSRCLALAAQLGQPCFHAEGLQQAKWLLRQAMLLTRNDGSQVLGGEDVEGWNAPLFDCALTLLSSQLNNRLASKLLPDGKRLVSGRRIASKKKKLPTASTISEWSETAVLRSSWSASSPQCTLTFGNQQMQCELSLRKQLIWSGDFLPEVRLNGSECRPTGDITMACQFQDKDVDYVEVHWDLSDGWQVQRQVLLARGEQLLFLADALIGGPAAQVEYRQTLPLSTGVEFEAAGETREGVLRHADQHVAHVLPLALAEWRSQPVHGKLVRGTSGLVLEQDAQASALYCPLLLDFSLRRREQPLTWRCLTVGEDRRSLPPHVAVGYRVQIGERQWLIYRSLADHACRTVLGQHFQYEFVVGRIARKGDLDTLVQIEAADE